MNADPRDFGKFVDGLVAAPADPRSPSAAPTEDQHACIVCRDEPVEEEGATCWRCEEIERNLNA